MYIVIYSDLATDKYSTQLAINLEKNPITQVQFQHNIDIN